MGNNPGVKGEVQLENGYSLFTAYHDYHIGEVISVNNGEYPVKIIDIKYEDGEKLFVAQKGRFQTKAVFE